jgi:hypothetical protein
VQKFVFVADSMPDINLHNPNEKGCFPTPPKILRVVQNKHNRAKQSRREIVVALQKFAWTCKK